MMPPAFDTSAIWRARRFLSRVALGSASALFITGLAMAIGGHAAYATILGSACAVLMGIPVLNVVAVLAEEIRRRDWAFAAVTGVVILLLVYSVVTRVLMRQ